MLRRKSVVVCIQGGGVGCGAHDLAYRNDMALTFQVDDKGQLDPKIRCDGCGGIIENYADGVALVDTPSPKVETVRDPVFLCSGCEESEQRKGDSRRSMPLDHFMLYLLNNIQLTPRALEDAGQRLRDTAWH